MIIEYYPKSDYGKLFLNPRSFQGVTVVNDRISQISLFSSNGVGMKITDEPGITRSPRYRKAEVEERDWRKLREYASEGNLERGLVVIGNIERAAEESPEFYKERGGDRKTEIMVVD